MNLLVWLSDYRDVVMLPYTNCMNFAFFPKLQEFLFRVSVSAAAVGWLYHANVFTCHVMLSECFQVTYHGHHFRWILMYRIYQSYKDFR